MAAISWKRIKNEVLCTHTYTDEKIKLNNSHTYKNIYRRKIVLCSLAYDVGMRLHCISLK